MSVLIMVRSRLSYSLKLMFNIDPILAKHGASSRTGCSSSNTRVGSEGYGSNNVVLDFLET